MSISNEAIIAVANAITANATVLQTLVNALPKESQAKIAAAVVPVQAAHVTAAPAPVQAPIATVAPVVPNVQPAPASVTPMSVAGSPSPVNVMPAPPTFVTPAPAPAVASGAPFTDGKGLIDYVMSTYKTLGAAKGAGIQGVLTSLGLSNINDVKPEQYAALYAGVEALKG